MTTSQNAFVDQPADGISLLDLAIVLAKHKRLIIGFPLAVTVIVIGLSFLIPNVYTATTRILPPQSSTSSASMLLGQLGALSGLAGGAAGVKSPSDLYIGMLKSRTVADKVIARFDLQKIYDEKLLSKTRSMLEQRTTITAGKDGIIAVDFDDEDPARAADIANAYADELMKLTTALAVTEASQRRLFFERQLVQAKDNLTRTEVAARQALQKGGLVKVDEQGRAMVETTARLRAQIAVKEVQMGTMRTFAAEGNPDLQRAQQELDALKREASRIEGASDFDPADFKAPGARNTGISNLGLLRDMKYYETVYELMAKQFELAKIDEAKDSSILQVIDKAILPDRKSKPKRLVAALVSAVIAGFIAIVWALVWEAADRAKGNPAQAERLRRLKSHFRLGRGSTV